jgi:hypothetical protein
MLYKCPKEGCNYQEKIWQGVCSTRLALPLCSQLQVIMTQSVQHTWVVYLIWGKSTSFWQLLPCVTTWTVIIFGTIHHLGFLQTRYFCNWFVSANGYKGPYSPCVRNPINQPMCKLVPHGFCLSASYRALWFNLAHYFSCHYIKLPSTSALYKLVQSSHITGSLVVSLSILHFSHFQGVCSVWFINFNFTNKGTWILFSCDFCIICIGELSSFISC